MNNLTIILCLFFTPLLAQDLKESCHYKKEKIGVECAAYEEVCSGGLSVAKASWAANRCRTQCTRYEDVYQNKLVCVPVTDQQKEQD